MLHSWGGRWKQDFRKEFSDSSLAVLRYLMGYFISKKEMGDENLACPPFFC
jgi:hypothetical protein